ncbi:uncharacterized protein LOC132723961 [Ruditapes philippinarum]|uniref:uncharacterized protein LOC132723961 n=1 Tax=Ruditapes philippinarum TaxID=129788 RepID=UPI00295A7544|nr:uncharacterized protein LOC132723961 [Ruditapes philippinarum]
MISNNIFLVLLLLYCCNAQRFAPTRLPGFMPGTSPAVPNLALDMCQRQAVAKQSNTSRSGKHAEPIYKWCTVYEDVLPCLGRTLPTASSASDWYLKLIYNETMATKMSNSLCARFPYISNLTCVDGDMPAVGKCMQWTTKSATDHFYGHFLPRQPLTAQKKQMAAIYACIISVATAGCFHKELKSCSEPKRKLMYDFYIMLAGKCRDIAGVPDTTSICKQFIFDIFVLTSLAPTQPPLGDSAPENQLEKSSVGTSKPEPAQRESTIVTRNSTKVTPSTHRVSIPPNSAKSPEEDSVSEMSEVLIPVISNQSSVIANKSMFEIQESQQIEESQSLLPQVPTEFHNLNMLREPNYSNVNNTEKDKWMTKKTDNIKARGGNKKNDFRENVSFIHTSPSNNISLSQATVISSQKDVNSFSQQIDSTSLNEGFIFSQPMVFASEEDVLTFSQVDNALNIEGEVVSSQRAVTLTEQKDPADRIISRLDRLVSSLDKVSTRQKMVIEATILQCITSLQDSLNNKLKKQQSTTDNAGIFKRLLQTTQTGLLKLTEKQRLEKLQMSQVGSQSMQHLNTQKLNQSALSDFGKRQKRVFSLLKRQKYLVDLFKSRKRSEIATDPNVRFKTDQKHDLSRQSETKQVSKSGIIQPNNTNLKRNHISKTCNKLSTERESETKIIGDSQTESKSEGAKDNDIVKISEELSKQVCFMRRGSKDSKLTKENMGEGLRNKDIEEEAALGKELKNGNKAGKADEVSCTVTDVTNKGGTELEDAEDCNLTQDLTTVPDTQDVISQDCAVGNSSDSGDVVDITADMSDNEISEFHMKYGVNGGWRNCKMNETS